LSFFCSAAEPAVNNLLLPRAIGDVTDNLMIVLGDKREEWLGALAQFLDKIWFCGSAESSEIHLINRLDIFG
jgi:hypothetical protein